MSVSFGKQVLPTKIELIRLRRSLKVARMVYKILDDKREVLLKRLDEIIEEAYDTREKLKASLEQAYNSLYDAYLSMGSLRLESIALTTPISLDVKVNVRTIVDVQVPTLEVEQRESGLAYGFVDTDSTLDKANRMMRSIIFKICQAAEVENSIYRLAKELEKTQRLINALEYVIIPQYENSIKFINSVLEEREREEFVRLKHVKKVLERRRGS
ncbi:MAG: V-type ATP synthase subunit D [Nitrososphaerales archaeon]